MVVLLTIFLILLNYLYEWQVYVRKSSIYINQMIFGYGGIRFIKDDLSVYQKTCLMIMDSQF